MAHPTFTMTGLSTRRRYSWDMAAIAPAPVRPGSGDQPTEMLRDRHAHWEYLGFWVLEILCEPSALPKSKLSQSRRQRSHPRSWGANGSHFRGGLQLESPKDGHFQGCYRVTPEKWKWIDVANLSTSKPSTHRGQTSAAASSILLAAWQKTARSQIQWVPWNHMVLTAKKGPIFIWNPDVIGPMHLGFAFRGI